MFLLKITFPLPITWKYVEWILLKIEKRIYRQNSRFELTKHNCAQNTAEGISSTICQLRWAQKRFVNVRVEDGSLFCYASCLSKLHKCITSNLQSDGSIIKWTPQGALNLWFHKRSLLLEHRSCNSGNQRLATVGNTHWQITCIYMISNIYTFNSLKYSY